MRKCRRGTRRADIHRLFCYLRVVLLDNVLDSNLVDGAVVVPGDVGLLVANAFTASDFVIVPMTADVYSYYGIELLLRSIDDVQENCNADLKLAGLFYNKYDTRTNIAKVIESTVGNLGLPIFKTSIRVDKNLREAPLAHMSAAFSAPDARAVKDYNDLVDEIEAL